MWLGVFMSILAFGIIKAEPANLTAGLLIASAGFSIVTSMLLRRRALARKLDEEHKPGAA